MQETQETTLPKQIGYIHLMLQALPEIFCFQLLSGIPLFILSEGISRLIKLVAESSGAAITTANLKDLFLSWRGPVILVLGILLVAVFASIEIFAQIHLFDDILHGRKVRIRREIVKGFISMRRFLCPSGFLVLLYIFIIVPLLGVGFSISLTENFYIPNFIMEVVRVNPLYNAAYTVVIVLLGLVGILGVFTLHGSIIDGKKPSQAFGDSMKVLKKNWLDFLIKMAIAVAIGVAIILGVMFFLKNWQNKLDAKGALYPQGRYVDFNMILEGATTPEDMEIVTYRAASVIVMMCDVFLNYLLELFVSAYIIMIFTRCYVVYTQNPEVRWPSRPKRKGFVASMILLFIFLLLLLAFVTVVFVLGYNDFFVREEPVRIVAHRCGGIMAPENSLEGIELAIEHGCYACETDTQRTKDGYYIINHDDDFKRLTGVAAKPSDLTLEEVRELVITDPVTGATAGVKTLQELLEPIKGSGVKLFIELKGATADRQMVDDVCQIVKDMDCVDEVALLSLKYDVIDYAETTYPEFETGMLIFGSIGDVARVNSDLMVLEEEMSTDFLIDSIHASGKEVYVWTINTEAGMHQFLNSKCDGIITDQIEMALKVQEELDNRSEFQIIRDGLNKVLF